MTKDEKLDEFLKRIGIELLPFRKRIYQEDSGRKQDLCVLSSACWAI